MLTDNYPKHIALTFYNNIRVFRLKQAGYNKEYGLKQTYYLKPVFHTILWVLSYKFVLAHTLYYSHYV